MAQIECMSEVIASGSGETNRVQGGTVAWGYCRTNGLYVPIAVDENGNLGVSGASGGDATAANQTTEIARLTSILAKIIAAPSTEAKQDTQITAEQAILAKLTADPATQTTLAAVLAKIIAAPATEANQVLEIAALGTPTGAAIITDADGTIQRYLRGLVAMAVAGTLFKQGGGELTPRSGTITSGGTSQAVAVANPARKYFILQNQSVEDLYVNFDASATAAGDSIKLVPGGSWESGPNFVPTDSVNVIGATTGSKFVAFEG